MSRGEGEAFTLLTMEPGPDVAPIHNRQMVVLERPDSLAWLDLTRPSRGVSIVAASPRQVLRGQLERIAA